MTVNEVPLAEYQLISLTKSQDGDEGDSHKAATDDDQETLHG
jgi:hypothetical protein